MVVKHHKYPDAPLTHGTRARAIRVNRRDQATGIARIMGAHGRGKKGNKARFVRSSQVASAPATSGKTSGISSHCVFGTPPGLCEFSLSPGRANGHRTLFSAKCLRKPKEIRGGVKITHFCIDLPPATISSHFCSDRWNAWPAPNFNENFGFLGENFLLHRIDAFEICGKITCIFHYISDMLAQCCPSQ